MVGEIADVLQAIESLGRRGERMALATIVGVRGSAYRRPGARLLVPETGEPVGNISGGCLEDDVSDVAKQVMADGEPRLLSFDLTADDEVVWGWGLGCNGVIEVFVEPAGKAVAVAMALRKALEEERPLAVVTVLDSAVPGVERGDRLLVQPGGAPQGSHGDDEADRAAADRALAALWAGRSVTEEVTVPRGEFRVFIEVLEPPLRLLVCGAGHDASPVIRFAASLGWNPVVVDDREGFLNRERFPEAAGFVHVDRPEHAARTAGVDPRTNVVVMSHNYLRDRDYLRSFLGTEVAYLGMLGPRARLDRLLADLQEEGVRPTPDDLAKIHGPAGLDIGSEGPEEIAWAIIAEVLATRRGRPAGFLRDRSGPIHDGPQAHAEAG
jgi:xanthine/CO dehydrogenase XdhC/CoxF family maturation factor